MLILIITFMVFHLLSFSLNNTSSLMSLWTLTITLSFSLFTSINSISSISQCSSLISISNFNVWINNISLWVTIIIILVSINYLYQNINFNFFLLVTITLLTLNIAFFITDNLILLYVIFEASLIPTLILIIQWGYQPERLNSAFYFIIYTICASLPLLLIIVNLISETHSAVIADLAPLSNIQFNTLNNISYLALTLAFIVNIPIWGVHLWLPNAHVEAPVSGSIILAGILLKLGGWGLIQISNFLVLLNSNINHLLFSINLWGAMAVGLICLTAVDINILIAYSSIVHINLITVGIISNSTLGLYGALLIIISHGISSPGIFALANLNYESTNTRNLILQKGFLIMQPAIILFWFSLAAANMAAPPSLNLASEILIYISALNSSFYLFLIPLVITFIGGAYNLYLFSAQIGNINNTSLPSIKINNNSIIVSLSLSLPVFLAILVTNTINQY